MSQVFLAGDRVYKLKKPVRFPYFDFSTLARREAACRAELKLNRRLAPDTYRDVVPLVAFARRVSPSAARRRGRRWRGRRLARGDESSRRDTDARPRDRGWASASLAARPPGGRSCAVLSPRQRRASSRPLCTPAELWRSLAYNRRILLDPRFNFHAGSVRLHRRHAAPFPDRTGRSFWPSACERAAHRRWARRPAPRTYLPRRSRSHYRLSGVQYAPAHGRSVRRNRVPLRRMRAARRAPGPANICAAASCTRCTTADFRGAFRLLSLPSGDAAGAPCRRTLVGAQSAHAGKMGAAGAHLSAACGGGRGAARKKPQSMIRKSGNRFSGER